MHMQPLPGSNKRPGPRTRMGRPFSILGKTTGPGPALQCSRKRRMESNLTALFLIVKNQAARSVPRGLAESEHILKVEFVHQCSDSGVSDTCEDQDLGTRWRTKKNKRYVRRNASGVRGNALTGLETLYSRSTGAPRPALTVGRVFERAVKSAVDLSHARTLDSRPRRRRRPRRPRRRFSDRHRLLRRALAGSAGSQAPLPRRRTMTRRMPRPKRRSAPPSLPLSSSSMRSRSSLARRRRTSCST